MKTLLIAGALALSMAMPGRSQDAAPPVPVTAEAQAAAITSLSIMPRTFELARVSGGKNKRMSILIVMDIDAQVLSMPYALDTGGAGNLAVVPGFQKESQNLVTLADVKAPGKYGITIAGRRFPAVFEVTK